MTTPFPGMDPYLERRSHWREIHLQLIAELARRLNPILRPRYRVATEQYTYTLTPFGPDDMIGVPDVMVIDGGMEQPQAVQSATVGGPTVAELPMPEEVVERYLEIRDMQNGEVITAIAILSPTNKVSKEGRQKYEEKRLKILGSRTHLVEIDLLRGGAPMAMSTAQETTADYRIVVSRSQQRPYADVYLFGIREPIPVVPIPLRPGETEPTVDLNSILHELYELLNFDMAIDYTQNATPPLTGKDAEWVDRLLRESGLR